MFEGLHSVRTASPSFFFVTINSSKKRHLIYNKRNLLFIKWHLWEEDTYSKSR